MYDSSDSYQKESVSLGDIEALQKLISEKLLLAPNLFITDVGAIIYSDSDFLEDE